MSQIDVALDQDFIDNSIHQRLEDMIAEEARVLSGYRSSLLSKLSAQNSKL